MPLECRRGDGIGPSPLCAYLLAGTSAWADKRGFARLTLLDVLEHTGWIKSGQLEGIFTGKAASPPLMPVAILPAELEDALDECWEMICPITLNLLIDPVLLHGKV